MVFGKSADEVGRSVVEIARYAPTVIRATNLARYSALALLACGCGGAPVPTSTIARSEPLPTSENQQGHPEVDPLQADEPPDIGVLPPDQPSIAGVFLWCQAPAGRACALASAALGTGPKALSGLPPSLLTVEDRSNDCEEPTIATVSARLAAAFSIDLTGWRDQGGSSLDMSLLGEMYQAAGCINDLDPTRPIAKISAADGVMPRVYLVRVWDGQTAPTY